MGCCFSSDEDKLSQLGEPTERTLLINPASNSTNRSSYRSAYCDDTGIHHASVYGHKGDEQSALNKILHQTATNVIDVSAMDSHLEQNDYLERSRHYQQRVNSNVGQRTSLAIKQYDILVDSSAPDKILSAPPLPQQEIQWMQQWTERVQQAVMDIKVSHKEDLVVQFGIP